MAARLAIEHTLRPRGRPKKPIPQDYRSASFFSLSVSNPRTQRQQVRHLLGLLARRAVLWLVLSKPHADAPRNFRAESAPEHVSLAGPVAAEDLDPGCGDIFGRFN